MAIGEAGLAGDAVTLRASVPVAPELPSGEVNIRQAYLESLLKQKQERELMLAGQQNEPPAPLASMTEGDEEDEDIDWEEAAA